MTRGRWWPRRWRHAGGRYAPDLWPVWIVAGLAVVVVCVAGGVAYWLVRRITEPVETLGVPDGIRLSIAILTVFGAVLAGVYAYRKQRISEGDAHRADATQFAERYSTAAGQLGHEGPAVRLAGVYAMARLADDWVEQRQVCVDVMCAYLRMPYEANPESDQYKKGEREVRQTIIRVIRDHLREPREEPSWSTCALDFTRATFDGGDFSGCRFRGSVSFADADFVGDLISFDGAGFLDCAVTFHGARFGVGAVTFNDARFQGGTVSFDEAQFSGSALSFCGALLGPGDITFHHASLSGGTLALDEARFSGGTVGFDYAQFGNATVTLNQARFEDGSLAFRRARFTGGTLSFDHAHVTGGSVALDDAEVTGGTVTFYATRFDGGNVTFDYGQFTDSTVTFHHGRFNGGTVSLDNARFNGGMVSFVRAQVDGGRVVFADAQFSGATVRWGRLRPPPEAGTGRTT
ncbi:pentapeptide repeat-containing protein [Streptomyces sp. NPDC056401]|uniref:pentapeptide repeat-containing protein n=1 Tax=Streptomyces sp. NPDC056401 TaxID=3345809 RepID=UPI0035E1EA75